VKWKLDILNSIWDGFVLVQLILDVGSGLYHLHLLVEVNLFKLCILLFFVGFCATASSSTLLPWRNLL
jgi:hypothetical protein